MRKTISMALALAAVVAALATAPKPAAGEECVWFCDGQTPRCSCPHPRQCTWPPPPMQCPTD